MTVNEGKALLEECWKDCQMNVPMDDVICYKYGNSKMAGNYQRDTIPAKVEAHEITPTMQYVVKCFIHLELYVAWSIKTGPGNGKYIAYKKDLLDMEANRNCTYQEKLVEGKGTAYYFRGKKGIMEFIQSIRNH